MPVTLTRVYQPPETIDYDPATAEVVLVRQYEARGTYPDGILGLTRTIEIAGGVFTDTIPNHVDVSVYKDEYTTFSPWGLTTARCFIANIHVEAYVAKSDEATASTLVAITYRGYVLGVVGHDLDAGTETALQKVDLNPDHVDAEGRPKGIGAKGEGVNKLAAKGEWVVREVCSGRETKDWWDRWEKIALLTSTVNEDNWQPTKLNKRGYDGSFRPPIWPEGWLVYGGADFQELSGPYFALTHTFYPAVEPSGSGFEGTHDARWRTERTIEDPAVDFGGGDIRPGLIKTYGPQQTSQIYSIAGQGANKYGEPSANRNVVSGRDLSRHLFADLEL